jgi:hypothetical protein
MFDPANPYAAPLASIAPASSSRALEPRQRLLRRVATGLGLIALGTALMAAGLIVIAALVWLDVRARVGRPALMWVGMLWLAGGLVGFIGSLFCLATPRETGARGLIFTSVGAALILALMFFIEILEALKLVAPLPGTINAVMRLVFGVAAVTFILFLWRLNRFVGRQLLARCSAIGAVYLLTATMTQLGIDAYLSTHPEAVPSMPGLIVFGLFIAYAAGMLVCAALSRATRRAILAEGTWQPNS